MEYALAALSLHHLLVVTVGIVVGIALGAMPGLSSTFACAVMLPLTFTMPPVTALIFLGSVYMASTYGGSLSAILLNTPGTPQSIATTLDGFPMAKAGDGNLALSLACVASVVGGLVGVLALVAIAPPLARMALSFGPAEFFWLAIFGLTMIASLSEANLIKGLLSGLLGVLLSMVGIAVVSADTRFTFDLPALVGGVPIVPATIGLLCVPVVIDMVATKAQHMSMPLARSGFRLREALALCWRGRVNLGRSSLIGIFVGILPAAGGAIASLVAYTAALRSARPNERYGEGEPNGIIASESANNTTVGSGLVPTFVLGIPGTPPDAVILAAMLIHGLQIGPALFVQQGDIVFTFAAGMTIASLLMLPIGLAIGQYIYAAIIRTPKTVLAPLIALSTLLGGFAIQNSYVDVVVMLVLGITAWIIGRLGFPAAPIVLGLLLGPIAERGYSQAMMIGQATGNVTGMFFGRPLSQLIIACIVVALVLPYVFKWLVAKEVRSHAPAKH
ncbi:MAG: C4-dicarboxylate ABC transporter permease [Geminicoccaceae bacterium]|nr:MAG: C4-dicarboxylate ABC transporter permease [Geminicoccaceae bacterium]